MGGWGQRLKCYFSFFFSNFIKTLKIVLLFISLHDDFRDTFLWEWKMTQDKRIKLKLWFLKWDEVCLCYLYVRSTDLQALCLRHTEINLGFGSQSHVLVTTDNAEDDGYAVRMLATVRKVVIPVAGSTQGQVTHQHAHTLAAELESKVLPSVLYPLGLSEWQGCGHSAGVVIALQKDSPVPCQ